MSIYLTFSHGLQWLLHEEDVIKKTELVVSLLWDCEMGSLE